ncbi:MAG: oxygen-independent coproporphyrinogen III oxidase [Alphaproteobacteria bacterium]|nr:oxygen-independent coproporphyrinogen III oxidase [Alphaproteobacteria bacterium]
MFMHRYATAALPRYTSYPPANRFEDEMARHFYPWWLDGLTEKDSLSLYVHVPFCAQLCWYCGCHTSVANDRSRIDRFVGRLLREVLMISSRIVDPGEVCSIHFGGGTPTMMSPEAFSKVMSTLRGAFAVRSDAEIAVEIDPRTLDDAHVEALAASGVTRASLGLQDVDPEVQRAINRIQPTDLVADRVAALRAAGIASINADLMYGLPGQTADHVRRSADAVSALGVDRVAVFGYAHVPWFKKHQGAIDATILPGAEDRFEQSEAAERQLVADGYTAIGIDHFARPDDSLAIAAREGRLRRNFQGYTADPADALIGFGPSSISALPGGYSQNETNVKHWSDRIDAGQPAARRGVSVSEDDRLRRAVIERVLCDGRVDLLSVAQSQGRQPVDLVDAFDRLAPLVEDGLVTLDGWRISATEAGRRYWRNLAACFDPGLAPTTGRHSVVV